MLKTYYKVYCFYVTKEPEHFHAFDIGIFDTIEKARQAVEQIEDKPGFCEHKDKIKIKKIVKLFPPKLLNNVYWADGFETVYY